MISHTRIFIILFVLWGIIGGSAYGRKRSVAEMDDIAASVFTGKGTETGLRRSVGYSRNEMTPLVATISSHEMAALKHALGENDAFRIYTFGNGKPGYVIVSTDDRLPGVLAFSETDELNIHDLPGSMVEMLADYSTALSATSVEQTSSAVGYSADADGQVEPLLGDIAFSQRRPYNNKCPLYNGERTITGCVATAMAQLMAYYKYPDKMKGEQIYYQTNTLKFPVTWDSQSTTFDWDNMLDTYSVESPEYTENETTTDADLMTYLDIQPSVGYNGYLEVYNFANVSQRTISFTVQLLLADNNGDFIRPIGTPKVVEDLKYKYYYSTYYLKHALPGNLPDGEYRMYVGVKLNGSSEWSYVKKATDSNNLYNSNYTEYYIPVTKKGTSYTVCGEEFVCGYSAKEAEAIATLCAANGASAMMDYTLTSSATNILKAQKGLIEHMGYDKSIAYLNKFFFTPESWIEFIKNELENGRPVYCSGHSEEGSGHAFIIDGYSYFDNIPYFHVNWGWNGGSNGYFLLDYLRPSEAGDGGYEHNYGYDLRLLTGVVPDNGKDDGFTLGAHNVTISFPSSATEMHIIIDTLTNCSYESFNGEILAYAVNEEREIFLGYIFSYGGAWNTNAYFTTLNCILDIPTYIPNGDYTLQLRALEYDATVETPVLMPNSPTFTFSGSTSVGVVSPTGMNKDAEKEIYDLSGRRIQKVSPQNIYIISGKKVIAE